MSDSTANTLRRLADDLEAAPTHPRLVDLRDYIGTAIASLEAAQRAVNEMIGERPVDEGTNPPICVNDLYPAGTEFADDADDEYRILASGRVARIVGAKMHGWYDDMSDYLDFGGTIARVMHLPGGPPVGSVWKFRHNHEDVDVCNTGRVRLWDGVWTFANTNTGQCDSYPFGCHPDHYTLIRRVS